MRAPQFGGVINFQLYFGLCGRRRRSNQFPFLLAAEPISYLSFIGKPVWRRFGHFLHAAGAGPF
jgi:hypothetical protein